MKKRVLLLPLCLVLVGCNETKYDENILPEDAKIVVSDIAREVYSNITIKDLIVDTNTTIINGNEPVNTETLGDHIYKLQIDYKGKKYNKDIKYTIVDDELPIMIKSPTEVTIYNGSTTNPCDSFVFADNYDPTPTCTVEGKYDANKNGTYQLKAIIKDSSDNEIDKNFTLTVMNEPAKKNTNTSSTASTSSNRLDIKTVISKYKNDNTMIGIDVSKWQGYIDYKKVKEDGVEFVIMRLGTQTDIANDISVDTYYYQNIKAAKEAGLKVGVYVASTTNTTELARKHALWTSEILNGVELDFPVAFDFERWPIYRTFKMSLHDLVNVYNEFANTLKEQGYDTMLYGSKWYLENIWQNSNDTTVWLAHYTDQTNYAGKYKLWQLSNKGKVNGINTDVDIDVYYK